MPEYALHATCSMVVSFASHCSCKHIADRLGVTYEKNQWAKDFCIKIDDIDAPVTGVVHFALGKIELHVDANDLQQFNKIERFIRMKTDMITPGYIRYLRIHGNVLDRTINLKQLVARLPLLLTPCLDDVNGILKIRTIRPIPSQTNDQFFYIGNTGLCYTHSIQIDSVLDVSEIWNYVCGICHSIVQADPETWPKTASSSSINGLTIKHTC